MIMRVIQVRLYIFFRFYRRVINIVIIFNNNMLFEIY